MKSTRSTVLFCFSPPIMLATFVIEIAFAFYIIWRYKMTNITRLVTAILLSLATFQAAEYMICGGMGIQAGAWSTVGYSAISLLPPLGIHLTLAIAKKKNTLLLAAAYGSAAAFIAYYTVATGAISGQTCYANYAVFDVYAASSVPYALFYYGWLMMTVWLAVRYSRAAKHQARALRALALGYCAFLIPTSAINLIDPSTISGIPSIMCGFAVILALVLVGKVAPESIKQKSRGQLLRLRMPF